MAKTKPVEQPRVRSVIVRRVRNGFTLEGFTDNYGEDNLDYIALDETEVAELLASLLVEVK